MYAGSPRRIQFRRPLAWAGMAVLALAVGTAPALAGHDDDEGYDRHGKSHGRSYHHSHGPSCGHDSYYRPAPRPVVHRYVPPPRFVVPAVIGHASWSTYSPYYHSQVYFAPHHHQHALYYFPVETAYGLAYEPHYYCGGTLLGNHLAYDTPRLSIRLGF